VAIAGIFVASGVHDRSYGEVAFGSLALVFALKTLRIRVVVDDDGLSVRNLLRNYRLSWGDVARLETVDARLLLGPGATGKVKRHRLVATTVEGQSVPLQATQSLYRARSGAGYFGQDATPYWLDLLRARWLGSRSEG
jgi:hypothetical protein